LFHDETHEARRNEVRRYGVPKVLENFTSLVPEAVIPWLDINYLN